MLSIVGVVAPAPRVAGVYRRASYGSTPLIAIQMRALSHADTVGLVFTTAVDELRLGLVDDDRTLAFAVADRCGVPLR